MAEKSFSRIQARCAELGLRAARCKSYESKVRHGILEEGYAMRLAEAERAGVDTTTGSEFWFRERVGIERPQGAVSYREEKRREASLRTLLGIRRHSNPPVVRSSAHRVAHTPTRREAHGRPAKANAPPDDDPDEHSRPRKGPKPRQLNRAKTLITAALKFGPQRSTKVEALLDEAQISTRTFWRARDELGVRHTRRHGASWLWLPGESDEAT